MLSAGDRFGPYVIVTPLGAGGMGEVYQARDTRLDRTVALKVLSQVMHQREDVRQRFQQEARAISKLNHPNICTLYDVGQQDGVDYLVMEYLEGETLEARLKARPLPPTNVLQYGREIANALDLAHRSGVVHRDLKPGNIMLTRNGAKLLDFGLAKSHEAATASDETSTQMLTEEGKFLGTLAYMSPEQLQGGQADARSDIFAFGCVLFEMLTRRKAFSGSSHASLIAAIMNATPAPIGELDFEVSPALVVVVRTCLAKEPANRWQSARDIALQLDWLGSAPTRPAANDKRPHSATRILLWAVGGVLIGALLGVLPWLLSRREHAAPLVQTEITAPHESEFSGFGSAISPDGRYVAFVATTHGKERLWLRSLAARNSRVLDDTDDAQFPFWSPDSRSIGFFSPGKLRRLDLDGVGARTIASAPNGRGASWSLDGTIVFSPNVSSRLWRVAATEVLPCRQRI